VCRRAGLDAARAARRLGRGLGAPGGDPPAAVLRLETLLAARGRAPGAAPG
jgi:hypothetical protein